MFLSSGHLSPENSNRWCWLCHQNHLCQSSFHNLRLSKRKYLQTSILQFEPKAVCRFYCICTTKSCFFPNSNEESNEESWEFTFSTRVCWAAQSRKLGQYWHLIRVSKGDSFSLMSFMIQRAHSSVIEYSVFTETKNLLVECHLLYLFVLYHCVHYLLVGKTKRRDLKSFFTFLEFVLIVQSNFGSSWET